MNELIINKKFTLGRILLFIFILLSSQAAQSVVGPNGTESYITSGTPAFTWDYDANGYPVIKTNSVRLVLQPGKKNPCTVIGCEMTYLAVGVHSDTLTFSWPGDPPTPAAVIQRQLGATGRINFRQTWIRSMCITFIDGSNSEAQYLPDDCLSGGGQPPITPIDPPLSCDISNGTIQHGVVGTSELSGHSANTNIEMSCNNKASARITSPGYTKNGIALDTKGLLTSRIKVDGTPLENGKNITLNKGQSVIVNISSELSNNGNVISAGKYSGSVVLRAEFD